MKLIIIDRDGHIKKLVKLQNIVFLRDFSEIQDRKNKVCLANDYAARELFGATQEKPIKYLGDRYDFYEYGMCIPHIKYEINDIHYMEKKFIAIKNLIKRYISEYSKVIDTIIYDMYDDIFTSIEINQNLDKINSILTE